MMLFEFNRNNIFYIHECHKSNLEALFKKDLLSSYHQYNLPDDVIYDYLSGLEIHFVKHIPKWIQKWEFPNDLFVEYDKKDEKRTIPIGYGFYIDTNEPYIIAIDDSLTIPKTLSWFGVNY